MPLTDQFISLDRKQNEFIDDIRIYQCEICGLVQNPIDFNHEGYYDNYGYSTGHSEFTRAFMRLFAETLCDAFRSVHGREPDSVLEIGSGDGAQLKIFNELGIDNVLGIEPSESLVRQSKQIGVPAFKGLFSNSIISELPRQDFDICLSSFTLDHMQNPADYLRTAHGLLIPKGILAFEVHDLSRIAERGEWCLFEHEHTIYLDADMAQAVLRKNGFKTHIINPLPHSDVRANSLIVVAYKAEKTLEQTIPSLVDYSGLQKHIDIIVGRIETWIDELPPDDELVGYGAGGRGVMTLATLRNANRFSTVFDSKQQSSRLSTPKSRIPVSGLNHLKYYNHSWCLIFSFGYSSEITAKLLANGYHQDRIITLQAFYGKSY